MTALRRRISGLALGGTLLLGMMAAAPIASAQEPEFPAFVPYCFNGATFDAEAGQDLFLYCDWAATTKGLVQMFTKADLKSHTLTDASGHVVWSINPKQGASFWSSPIRFLASDAGLECKQRDLWRSRWSYTVPALPVGTYTLTTNEAYSHPVNDGYHTCSFEGQPISPTPSLYPAGPQVPSVVTIVVSAAQP